MKLLIIDREDAAECAEGEEVTISEVKGKVIQADDTGVVIAVESVGDKTVDAEPAEDDTVEVSAPAAAILTKRKKKSY